MIITFTIVLCGCCISHETIIDEAVAPSCTEEGLTEGSHCSKCGEVLVSQNTLSSLGHEEEIITKGIPATCTSIGATDKTKCKVCKITNEHAVIEKLKHNYVYRQCTLCGENKPAVIDYSDISIYHGKSGYSYFETVENGEKMRKLYDDIVDELTKFHTSDEINATKLFPNTQSKDFTVARFNFLEYDLTISEASCVARLIENDHPIFYWLHGFTSYDKKTIIMTTTEDYANGKIRADLNKTVYKGIEEFVSLTEGETSPYNIALIYHNAIINSAEYAYKDDGEPEDSLWAHSILGAFTEGSFVCEGYAKLFHLLLTVSNIDSIYVLGETSSFHAWNMARMDDGEWYFFDVTIDDSTKNTSSNKHMFFCGTKLYFKSTHTPYSINPDGIRIAEDYPEASKKTFKSSEFLTVGEKIKIDLNTYEVCGYKTLKKVSGSKIPPQIVVYEGTVYNVVN